LTKLNLRSELYFKGKRPWVEVYLLRSMDWLNTAIIYFGARYFTGAIRAERAGHADWFIDYVIRQWIYDLICVVPALVLGAAILKMPFKIWVWIRLALAILVAGAGIWQGAGDSISRPPWQP
jgi:hypothetical protein